MPKPKLEKEVRCVNINPGELLRVEKRTDGDEEKDVMVLEGYSATFDDETLIGDEEWGWIESIDPHAFDDADMKDCCLKYNHNDTSPIMARTKNNSLKLTIDDKGLFMRAELIDTQSNKDFYKMVKAGLLDKMSFAFTVEDEDVDNRSHPVKRIIKRIGKLFDVSVVDIPAYDSTSLIARSKAMAEAQPVQVETRATEEEELENEPAKVEEEPKTEPTELENEVDSVKDKPADEGLDNQEAKPDEEERKKKVFEFKKRKAIAKLKLGGFWYE